MRNKETSADSGLIDVKVDEVTALADGFTEDSAIFGEAAAPLRTHLDSQGRKSSWRSASLLAGDGFLPELDSARTSAHALLGTVTKDIADMGDCARWARDGLSVQDGANGDQLSDSGS